MNTEAHRLDQITEVVIGCAFRVSNVLGCGFLEKVYRNALKHEILKAGLNVLHEVRYKVMYDGVEVGEYIADLVVESCVIIELKAVKGLDDIHMAQCINILRATNIPVCLLMNFAKPRLEFKRVVGPSAQQSTG